MDAAVARAPWSAGRVLVPVLGAVVLLPWISAPAGLVLGILLAVTAGNPWGDFTRPFTRTLLGLSVMGLGAGMDLGTVTRAGLSGIGYTVVGIVLTMAAGYGLGALLGTGERTSVLLTVGTAICGGSAIAAVAPVIRARDEEVSVSLATVFTLNAAALLVFPVVGHALALGPVPFGLWCALAIHDTSSVVGAALSFGPRALEVATTVKLARALWIAPVALALASLWRRDGEAGKPGARVHVPWFILGFVVSAALVTFLPGLQPAGLVVAAAARRTLVLTLFLIGAALTRKALKSMGLRPFLQGFLLWILVSTVTLGAIALGWVR